MATIKISQLTERLNYPSQIRAALSTVHGEILSWLMTHFKNTARFKNEVLSTFNTVSYYYLAGDTMPEDWVSTDPLKNIENVDRDLCKNALRDIYLSPQSVEWDIAEADRDLSPICQIAPPMKTTTVNEIIQGKSGFRPAETLETHTPVTLNPIDQRFVHDSRVPVIPTSPKDLYIQPPDIPRFDTSVPWFRGSAEGNDFIIYKSLPEIPTTQREISCSTQVDRMIDRDLVKLFPNTFIRTRHASMYDPNCGLKMDSDLGAIIPIKGFSSAQVKDNIIRYPHIFRLYRMIDDKRVSFYNHIEIAGKLIPIHEIWFDLPESKEIPHTIEFMKEYVVRRYLLERDMSTKGVPLIHHVYPVYGAFDEFLTLFAPAEQYAKWGFNDSADLARRCVKSRVAYKQSRNPILEVCRE